MQFIKCQHLADASVLLSGAAESGAHAGVVCAFPSEHSSPPSSNTQVHFGLLYQSVTGAKIVEIAHMEIAEPTIEQAIGELGELLHA